MNPSATATSGSSNYKGSNTTNPGTVTFTISAPVDATGYHFSNWSSDSNVTFANANSANTTVTVKVSDTEGSTDAVNYNIKANYIQNVYYASLTAKSGGNGTVSVKESTKSTTTSGGNVTFEITATPSAKYHLVEWSTTGSGTFANKNSTSTTFTAPASTKYNESNKASYTVTATFAIDVFGAKLNVGVSTKGAGSAGGTVSVSSNNSSWGSSASGTTDTKETDVKFYIKATPNTNYKFVGWSTTSSGDKNINVGATGEYSIKSASVQGTTHEETIYAIFEEQYDITVKASSTNYTAGDNLVFVVKKGEETQYRIAVPVGGSKKILDVPKGSYTVTSEAEQGWNYTVSSLAAKTLVKGNNDFIFTVTSKGSTKKHDEAINTKSY